MKPGRSGGAYPRAGEPITFGVPLPFGAVHGPDAWRLRSPSGHSSAVQTRILDRWRDGSGRWMLVDGRVDLPSSAETQYVLESAEAAPLEARINLTEQGRELTVETGPATFRIGPATSELFNLDGAGCLLRLIDGSGV